MLFCIVFLHQKCLADMIVVGLHPLGMRLNHPKNGRMGKLQPN